MSTCERCWRDSQHPYESTSERYRKLLDERKDTPCTPEQQAGPDATECPKCKTMTLHQHTRECMNRDCDYWPGGPERIRSASADGEGTE